MSALRYHRIIAQHRIGIGVVLALVVAGVLTMASMALYVSSGASRLDLSRPGYEKARTEITKNAEKERFSASGPVDEATMQEFQARFNKRRGELNSLGAFNSTALDDTQLQLAPAEQPVQ